jgi:superfamily I DNA/RNA helicase
MALTNEQQEAADNVLADIKNYTGTTRFTAIRAIAGSGKSSTLRALTYQIDEQIPKPSDVPHDIFYMVFNKSMQKEALEKGFPDRTSISTIHALAYRYVVAPAKLRIGNVRASDLPHKLPFKDKIISINLVNDFAVSEFLDYETYLESYGIEGMRQKEKRFISLARDYMNGMISGQYPISHNFYMKIFHKLLASGSITFDSIPSCILFDEAQDAVPVALEIFRHFPSKAKVFVGDANQNIYGFMNTVSIFDKITEAKEFSLTQSFRVNKTLALKIESFCQNMIQEDFIFKGVPTDPGINTKAYIYRSNSSVIQKAIELTSKGIDFNLVRDISDMFDLPIMIISINSKTIRKIAKIIRPEHYFLIEDFYEYIDFKDINGNEGRTFTSFVREKHKGDDTVDLACAQIITYGPAKMLKVSTMLKERDKMNIGADITVCTAHSSKGLEFDQVIIGEDLNEKVEEIREKLEEVIGKNPIAPIFKELPDNIKSEIYLYYVATTRCKKELINATHITQ